MSNAHTFRRGVKGRNIVPVGYTFGRLTYVKEAGSCSRGKRKVLCTCSCGEEVVTLLTYLCVRKVQSCGCLNSELSKERTTKHGMDGTRLNECWKSMNARAKRRGDCNVCEDWKSFENFYKWAIASGYKDSLVLARRLDTGDYCPDNTDWVTKTRNGVEAHAYYWKITSPLGEVFEVYNMNKFSKEMNIPASALSQIASNTYPYKKWLGWKVVKLSHGTDNKRLGVEELDIIFESKNNNKEIRCITTKVF